MQDNFCQTTSFLAAAILVYALGAGITAGAGTRLVLQLVLVRFFRPDPFHVTSYEVTQYVSSLPPFH